MQDLGTLGLGIYSRANDINAGGQIVGQSFTELAPPSHACLWDNGTITDLGTLGGTASWAEAINDAGQVVGQSWTQVGTSEGARAFFWEDGVGMSDLGTLGGSNSAAFDINEKGQIVGNSYIESGDSHACLWENGSITDLGTLGGHSCAYSINEHEQIVGLSHLSSPGTGSDMRAFLWEKGTIFNLNLLIPEDSGWELTAVYDINDSGEIVGYGTINGETHGFLLTPVSDGDGDGDGDGGGGGGGGCFIATAAYGFRRAK